MVPKLFRPWVWMLGWSLIIATMSVVVLNDAQIDWRKKRWEDTGKRSYWQNLKKPQKL